MITFSEWIKEHAVGKNVNWKQTMSKGNRSIEKDNLSDDYVGHMANMGATWPFKLKGKKKKGKK